MYPSHLPFKPDCFNRSNLYVVIQADQLSISLCCQYSCSLCEFVHVERYDYNNARRLIGSRRYLVLALRQSEFNLLFHIAKEVHSIFSRSPTDGSRVVCSTSTVRSEIVAIVEIFLYLVFRKRGRLGLLGNLVSNKRTTDRLRQCEPVS